MLRFINGKISISLAGFGSVEGFWEPDDRERNAAWELYIELVTRIAVVELRPGEGSLREALSSLYSIFPATREILRKYGPVVGRPAAGSDISFGYVAIAVLNYIVRPALARWHPQLLEYESGRGSEITSIEHENRWAEAEGLRRTLNEIRSQMIEYTSVLAEVANVPVLHGKSN